MANYLAAGIIVWSLCSPIVGTAAPASRVVETRRADGSIESRASYYGNQRNGRFETFWPNGRTRTSAQYRDDVFHGEYRTWSIDGSPYELKHFDHGREFGRQQSWDPSGKSYLNYEVRDGRRYGMQNAKPCLPAGADGLGEGGAR